MKNPVLFGVTILSMVGLPAAAQERSVPPSNPEKKTVRFETTPSQIYLMKAHNISRAEAVRRDELGNLIAELSQQLSTTDRDNFGGLYIQQAPTFRVIVGFKNPESRSNFRDTIEPRLRSVVCPPSAPMAQI